MQLEFYNKATIVSLCTVFLQKQESAQFGSGFLLERIAILLVVYKLSVPRCAKFIHHQVFFSPKLKVFVWNSALCVLGVGGAVKLRGGGTRTCSFQVGAWGGSDLPAPKVGVKRKIDDVSHIPLDAVAERQRAWLSQTMKETRPAWRPAKRHRTGAKKWLIALDNQIKTTTSRRGLVDFQYNEKWGSDWRLWPCVGVSSDLGSDGVSAIHAMLYKYDISMYFFPDESHAIKNSFVQFLKDVKLWNLWLLFLISWNLEHGPRESEERRAELRSKLDRCYESRGPEDSPLFTALLPMIVVELETNGEAHFDRTRPLEIEVWNFLKERNRYGSMGRRVSMARYGASLAAALKQRNYWSVQLWERSFVAIENDHLWKKGGSKVSVHARHAQGIESASTSQKPFQFDDKVVRGMSSDAVAMSVYTLQSREHQRALDTVCAVSKCLSTYHSYQNAKQRSVDDCEQFIVEVSSFGFIRHLQTIMMTLVDANALREAGFLLPAVGSLDATTLTGSPDVMHVIQIEDEYATLFGLSVMSLVKARAHRGQWLFAWPTRMFRALSSTTEGEDAVSLFMRDVEAFKDLQRAPRTVVEMKDVLERHVMNLRSNKQLLAAILDIGSATAPKDASFLKMLHEVAKSITATQLVEDFNAAQSVSSLAPCRRYRRPATALALLLEQQIASTRHRFDSIEVTVPAQWKRAALPKSAFEPVLADSSVP